MNFKTIANRLLLTAAALLLTPSAIKAQGVNTYDSKKGLSSTQVQTIYEDSRNNVWITTRNGLNRFDGVKMNNYHHVEDDEHSLRNDITNCVFEYDKEHLLVGLGSGIQSYSHATDKFTNVPFITERGDTISIHIISFSRLRSSGDVYACAASFSASKIMKDDNGNLYAKSTQDFNTPDGTPVQIFEDSRGTVWVLDNRSNIYIRQNGKMRQITSSLSIRRLCESSYGNIYAGSMTDGLLIYDWKKGTFEPACNIGNNNELWSIRPWTDGRIFICTDGSGLKVYDESTGTLSQSPIQVNDFNLSTSNVKDAICDSFGSVWVGIYWRGVMHKTANQTEFDYVGRMSITKNTIGNNPVTAMTGTDKDRLWVATDHDGLYRLSHNGSVSTHWSPETTPNMPSTINSIYEDRRNNRIWLGSYATGLKYMDENSGTVHKLNVDIPRVFDICPAPNNGIWAATMGFGLYYYNIDNGTYIHYTSVKDNNKNTRNISGNIYIACLATKGKLLFAGGADGLNGYEMNGAELKHLSKIFAATYVNCLKIEGNELWAATNKGIYVINIKTLKVIATYDSTNGLPNNVVNSIEFDGNNVWMGTGFGLACYDRKAKTFHSFFAEDGLQDNEFGVRTSTKIGNDLWFGGISGINRFSDRTLNEADNSQKAKLRFINLYINNKQIYQGDLSGDSYNIIDGNINEVDEINLAHNDNNITIEVAALGLGTAHAIYEYSLDGSDWKVQSEHSNNIILSNLTRGSHTLKVRAMAYHTVTEERTLAIIVHDPWYLSPVAMAVYFILFLILAWVLYLQTRHQIHVRRILAKHRKEEEINEARIQFFMNINHEIRTPMTLILSPLEKLISTDKDGERQRNYRLIHQNAKRIMRLINQMMDARKIEKGQYKLDFRPMEMVEFMQNIYDVFSANAQNRGINFRFVHTIDRLVVQGDPENLDKIVMNLLSNAFKFTPDNGKIILSLQQIGKEIEIKVTDTGSGISDADKPKIFERFYSAQHQNGYIGTGIGLNLTYLLVQMHKGSIVVNDNPEGKGTEFIVRIPYINANDADIVVETTATPKKREEEEGIDLPTAKTKVARHRNLVLCEDDNAIRSYVRSELSNEFRITEFINGQEGWDYIQLNPDKVDLVITDIMMPVMDGLALCEKIKRNYNTSHIPVIMTTALGTDNDRITGLDTGADAYVTKPFNMDVLRSTANSLLSNRNKLQGKWTANNVTEEHIEKREVQSIDDQLLTRVAKVINEHIDDPNLNVEAIADKVGISRVHFYRKMKELTGQSPRDFLKTIRLKEAARLLSEKHYDITTVCVETGFKNLSSFSTSFKSVYGISPTEYAKSKNNEDEKNEG